MKVTFRNGIEKEIHDLFCRSVEFYRVRRRIRSRTAEFAVFRVFLEGATGGTEPSATGATLRNRQTRKGTDRKMEIWRKIRGHKRSRFSVRFPLVSVTEIVLFFFPISALLVSSLADTEPKLMAVPSEVNSVPASERGVSTVTELLTVCSFTELSETFSSTGGSTVSDTDFWGLSDVVGDAISLSGVCVGFSTLE